MPKGAKAARSSAGNTIPMVFVTTADGETSIAGISYDTLKADIRDANRDLKKTLNTVDVLGSGSELEKTTTDSEASTEKPGFLAEIQAWKNSDGKEITAAIKSFDGTNVVFVMGGREVSYPISKLSEESRKKIEELSKL
jgi:hypothetical protein